MNARIASLLPCATEIVSAIGHGSELVGVSHECDFPVDVKGLPILTRARLHGVKSSREIDQDVRALVEQALAIYEIDVGALEVARPDVVVTQDLCDVCAVSLDDVRSAVARLARNDVRIVNLHPTRLDDVWDDVVRVAEALGDRPAGERVAAELRSRTAAIAARASACEGRPSVLTVEWVEPVMVGGLWMPELVHLAGGTPLVTSPGEHAPTLSRDALASLSPDVVVVKPCGFPLAQTVGEMASLRASLPWEAWSARKPVRVYLADGNAFFNRPGPRIVESLEILAACTHPEAFSDLARKHAASFVCADKELLLRT
ncbi:MAG TPA: ABC transporter substrate-binding protein [Polyangiaceae bacterium]|nr:ABC transporter substrate-binding protein [Polyangiaceae bacterium]